MHRKASLSGGITGTEFDREEDRRVNSATAIGRGSISIGGQGQSGVSAPAGPSFMARSTGATRGCPQKAYADKYLQQICKRFAKALRKGSQKVCKKVCSPRQETETRHGASCVLPAQAFHSIDQHGLNGGAYFFPNAEIVLRQVLHSILNSTTGLFVLVLKKYLTQHAKGSFDIDIAEHVEDFDDKPRYIDRCLPSNAPNGVTIGFVGEPLAFLTAESNGSTRSPKIAGTSS
jgi:hypothetical protein